MWLRAPSIPVSPIRHLHLKKTGAALMRFSWNLAVIFSFIVTALLARPASGQSFRTESFQGQDVVAGEILVRFRDATGMQAQALAAQDSDLASAEPVGRSGAVRLRSRNRNATALLQAYRN